MNALNRVEISARALRHNFGVCRHYAADAAILAMVKGEAYGHGMVDCARLFVAEGAASLGVAQVGEGVTLRQAGITAPIFVLAGITPQSAAVAVEHGLTPVIGDGSSLDELAFQARRVGRTVRLHLKMDAGMGRQGTLPGEMSALIQGVLDRPGLAIDGILAHFPEADEPGAASSSQVVETFRVTSRQLEQQFGRRWCLHLANSGGLLYVSGARFDMVRPGIMLYGSYPDAHATPEVTPALQLQPAMRFSSQVIQVRQLPAGTGLGYGHSWTSARPTTIAVLPVGYSNGYLRRLSNRASVLIRGRRVPVVGRVSMNLTMVDATDLEQVEVGDEAVLLGTQQGEAISADEIGAWMETISYEVLCLFGGLNRRSFLE
ncbi:alanine racemase [Desulfogranum mediterraneum]|uniref:alanine racemase n=1 Tax=Desulfogranum mediterraneum TaxID=160661 RepID=UPI0004903336|nr:alanine racemase [Desulfogranum mediterraneum]